MTCPWGRNSNLSALGLDHRTSPNGIQVIEPLTPMIPVNPLLVLSGLGLSTACLIGYSLGPVDSLGDLVLFVLLALFWLVRNMVVGRLDVDDMS
jgi:hypothetical protein